MVLTFRILPGTYSASAGAFHRHNGCDRGATNGRSKGATYAVAYGRLRRRRFGCPVLLGNRVDEEVHELRCAIDGKAEGRGAPLGRPEAQYDDSRLGV